METKMQKVSSEFYEKKGGWKHITIFNVDGFQILAESESDALQIYEIATKENV
jgi:hypothetical protein